MKYWCLLIFVSLFCSFSQAQSLQLLNPDGGQVLSGSSNYSITWQYSNVTNIRIELSTDSGSTYQMIAANIAASTLSYNWLIPTIGSTKCFIKITDLSSLISSRSALVFTILPPSISLIYPNGGQQFYAQQGVTIQWQSISVSTLKAEYTVNNGSSWQTIANGIPASNNYLNFTIPSTISSGYRVRLLAESNNAVRDSSNTNFSVIGNYAISNPIKYRGGSFDGYSMRNNLLDSIVIKTPNGGQTLLGASSYSISWAYNNLDNIKIEYSIDSGSTWTNIISNISASTLSYTWIVPSTGSNKCLIKITDIVSGISDMSDSVFTISPPSISLIYPSGGEQFKARQGSYINWNSVSVNTVKIEYTSNGSTWQLLAAGIPASNNFYNFTIPNLISNLYRVRVVAESNNAVRDSSHNNFAVTGNFPSPSPIKYLGGSYDGYSMQNNLSDSIRINNPNGGEQLEGGLNYDISWNYNNVEDIKIDYSIDSGNTWSLIASNISAAKLNFSWLVPTILGGSNRCLIRITDNRTGIFDISDTKFTILAPSISLIFPNGGEQFKSQQGIYINWNSSSVSTVNIDYSANGGTNWINISNNVKASQKYLNWTVPSTIGNTYKVRVAASSTTTVGDTSNSFFANIGNYSNPNATKYRGGSYDGYDQYSLLATGIAPPQASNITGPDTICANAIQTFRVNKIPGENYYLWQKPIGWQFLSNNGDTFVTMQCDSNTGPLSVTIYNIFGASPIKTKSVLVQTNAPALPLPIIGDTLVCKNSPQTFKIYKVANGSSYNWNAPSNWSIISNTNDTFINVIVGSQSGLISVRGNNTCFNGPIRTINIKVDSLPLQPSIINGNATPCFGSSQTFSINRIKNASSYVWSVPSGTSITSAQNDTFITATVGSNNGNINIYAGGFCGNGPNQTLGLAMKFIPPPPTSIFGDSISCKSVQSHFYINRIGSATQYLWSAPIGWSYASGQADTVFVVSPNSLSGNISVAATNICGTSTSTNKFSLSDSIPLQPLQVFGPTLNCIASSKTYTINRIGNASSYTWNVPAGWNITSVQNDTFIVVTVGSNSGNISVTANNSCGNSLAKTLAVSTITIPVQPGLISGNSVPCLGSSNLFIINKVNTALSYNWSFPSGWSNTTAQGDTSITISTGSSNGNVVVSATNSCGTSSGRNLAATVQVIPVTPASIIGSTHVCKQTSNTFRINRISNASNYTYTVPTGWVISSGGIDTFITVITNSNSGNITVKSNNTCGSSLPISLFILTDSIPTQPSAVSGNTNVCGGSTQIFSTSRVANASSYSWSLPNGWTINSGQGDTLLNTTSGVNSGNVIVQASNLCGSSSQRTLGIIVSGSLPPQASAILGNNFPCLGSTQVYTIPRVPLALSYTWSVPNGWTINAGQNDTFINVTVGPNSGNIQVTATNFCGTNSPRILAVNSNTIPSSPTAIIGSNAVCKLGTSLFKINRVIGATTYNWSLPSGWGFLSAQGDSFVNTLIGSLGGSISVSAGNVCGNSSSIAKSTSLDSIPPIPSAISGNANPCLGSGEAYSISTIPNATSYNWSLPSGWIINSGTSTFAITGTIGSNNGNILVSSTNFCGTSSNRTLAATVKTIPSAPVSIIGNLAVCKQSSATYKINRTVGATSYTWTVPIGWSINNGNGDTIITVTVGNTGGNINVYASNICGNSTNTSIAVSVDSIPPQPAIITGNNNPCLGSSQAFSISNIANATSYNWIVPGGWNISAGQTLTNMQTMVGSSSGNIQVAAVNFCGTGTYKILATMVESIPVIPASINGNTAVCKSTLQTFTTNKIVNASTYTWTIPIGWTIITGLNDTFITVSIGSLSGNVSVKANNFCGSSLNRNLFINVDSIPPQPTVISGNLNPCNGSQVTYSATILPNANSYVWTIPSSYTINGNQTGSTINVNIGSIDGQITVSGSNMCGVGNAKSSNLVVKNIPMQPNPVNGNTAVCKSSLLTYHIAPVLSASAYLWSVPTGWIINSGQGDTLIRVSIGSKSGNVSVVASNNCGSGIARTLFVNVDSIPPIPNQITGNNAPCANNTLNYSISRIDNANSYNWYVPTGWVINTGQGDTAINTTISKTNGSILVSATNVCGTSLNRSLTIQVDSNPIIGGNISGLAKPCYGIAQNYSIPNVSNATSYIWTAPANWTNNSGQGTTSINVSPSNTVGNISVIASNKCGLSNQKVYTVGYDSIPVQPKLITGNTTPCSNSNYAYAIENISNALNYVWTIPTGWNLINNLGSNVFVKTSDSSGQISVYAQNSCGIGFAQNLTADIVTIPSKPILIQFEDTLCSASNYIFKTDSDYFAKNYNWSLPSGYVINSGQGSRTINFTASNISGNIKIVANNGICYGDTNYQYINVTRTPAIPNLITGNFAPCYTTNVTYFTQPDSLSDSYFWKYPIDWNPQGLVYLNSINLITGSQNGKIGVQAIKLGCKSSFKEENLNVQFIPITPTIISGETYVRSNETKSYSTPIINNAINYNWTLPSDWAILNGNGTNEVSALTGDSSGLIRVNATNVCGTSNSKSLQVYSGVANGITNINFDDAFGLYPVPSSDFITVEINGDPNEIIEWTIFTLLGQKAQTGNWKMKTKGTEAFQIDISSLRSANYVFELNTGSNKIYKKIVIVR